MAYHKLTNVDFHYVESGLSGIGGGLEVELPSPESRRGSLTILDHIKRSAGSTPAKKSIPPHHHHPTMPTSSSSLRGVDPKGATDHRITNDGFSMSLTASTSGSTTDDDMTEGGLASSAFALFQSSQSLSQKEDDGPDFSTHDDTYDDKYETRLCHNDERRLLHDGPLDSVSSMEEQFLYTNFQPPSPQRIAGHHLSRTTRLLQGLSRSIISGHDDPALSSQQHDVDEQTAAETAAEASPSSSSLQSRASNDDSTCWIEDGGNRISSLFDHSTNKPDNMANSAKGNESEDDDDDEYTVDGSQFTTDDHPLNAVESFLDELADVEDVNQLRNLLLQMGSCHFSGHESVDDSAEDYYDASKSGGNRRACVNDSTSFGHNADNHAGDLYGERQTTNASQHLLRQPASSSPQSTEGPQQQTVMTSAAVMDEELTTVDSFSLNQILQNWSLQADTIMDIVTNSTILSQSTDDDDGSNLTPLGYNSSTGPTGAADQRPKKLTAMAFLSSMFGCQQGGGYL